ncbi:hypothetical protein J2751_000245 [Halorubrum alkaliphilum]|uniref:HEAT repeat domain-containing protein n=1 Tax=Halorubrum alkaliphilum TaxID=261290 RepID=A0A8T4GDD2_9EURY|nr:hypothetical protein [Halorubrum alkaliphilum]MBP1921262.1 hypothetical protein [Halorubrum alkaliphilum]
MYDLLDRVGGPGGDDVDLRVGGIVLFRGGVPMTGPFQRAVKGNVEHGRREEAIATLAADGRIRDLAVLVRTRGLPGGLRRRAIDGLGRCGAEEALDDIATDSTVPDELRRTAERR